MDVSDGLVQDLGHICRAGGLAAEIDAALVPLSDAARAAGPDWLATCLTGGDDYELLLAVPPAREAALRQAAHAAGMAVTRIGVLSLRARRGHGARARRRCRWRLPTGGWSHF